MALLGPWGRRLATVAVVAAVLSPALRTRDSYPLSTYPVYATARQSTASLNTAVGLDDDGRWHRLSLAVIAATDDPLIAEDRVADAVRDGRTRQLCTAIADRAAERGWGERSGGRDPVIAEIEVVTERVDLVLTVAENAPPLDRTVHARCPVGP